MTHIIELKYWEQIPEGTLYECEYFNDLSQDIQDDFWTEQSYAPRPSEVCIADEINMGFYIEDTTPSKLVVFRTDERGYSLFYQFGEDNCEVGARDGLEIEISCESSSVGSETNSYFYNFVTGRVVPLYYLPATS